LSFFDATAPFCSVILDLSFQLTPIIGVQPFRPDQIHRLTDSPGLVAFSALTTLYFA